ncbi:TolB family protein [Halalkalibaculum sp. DA3122]|uniref:TolB family protein n=1 Tax=Halalkalibaculum sp. DA3122 TaxID=3373607 RepID=UPI0037545766
MKRIVFIAILAGFCATSASAQWYPNTYRPPGLNWQELQTPHFKIVFPDGEDSVAYRTARILEHEYPEVQQLVGGQLSDFPVVLNNYNDRSNGFVSSLHFRSEIEIPPIKGKTMNPRSGNWLETVVPHELVHALHYNHLDGFWARIVKLFSPDAARSIQGSVPQGVHEGIATYYETAGVTPGGGRGNYPYFRNQFDAVFSSSERWSLGEMLSISAYSRPFDRHYIGGYQFTSWLQRTYGGDATREAIDFFIRWPFLGYGTALRHSTGQWPGTLYDQFVEDQERGDEANFATYDPMPIRFEGAEIRRPAWLNDRQLLVYGSFYNASPGFYTYSLEERRLKNVIKIRSVGDYNYDLSSDKTRLLFSSYRSSPIYHNTFIMDLYEADIPSGSVKRVSTNLRAFAPVYQEDGLLALQTDQESNALVMLDRAHSALQVNASLPLPDTKFVSVKPNPSDARQLAVVANRRGLQGLWIVHEDSIRQEVGQVPEISFEKGSVFDPAWHPSGNRLMFSSDHTGTLQLYEYNLETRTLSRITSATHNAMEGSYSPDGERIAFVIQQKNERLPVILERSNFAGQPVPASRWSPSDKKERLMARKELGSDLEEKTASWQVTSYQPGGEWIRPRTIMPTVSEISNSGTYEAGLSFHSNDLLQRNAYQLDLSHVQRRLWYDLTYRHTGFFPGMELNAFSTPSFNTIMVENQTGNEEPLQFLRQDVGASAGIPTRVILENNVRFSSVAVTPSVTVRGTRFFELDHNGEPASNYAHSAGVNLSSSLAYRVQQNIRDLQPNSGLVFYSELEHFFGGGSASLETADYQQLIDFSNATAWHSGLFFYTAPLKHLNQSLRVGIEAMTQTAPVFDNQRLVSNGFSEPVFAAAKHLLSVNTRYTIPLFYPDAGGFFFPAYLSNLYLVGFSDTVADVEHYGLGSASRTVLGLGLRTRFRISNLTFDLGVAVGYEPARNHVTPFAGNF